MALVPARRMRTRPARGPEDVDREFVWTRRESFGPWLREQREQAGYSLRAAAAHLGISFTQLQKMETGGRYKAPPLKLLADIGALYRVAATDVMAQAGIRIVEMMDLARAVDFESGFRSLVLSPPLRPAGVDGPWLDFLSPLQQQQWVDFARALERQIHDRGPMVEGLLAGGASDLVSEEASDPQALGLVAEDANHRRPVDGILYYWSFEPAFGPWLRKQRERAEVSIRQVSRDLDLQFTTLQRLETGHEDRPAVGVLEKLAVYLGIPLEVLFERAGYRRGPLSGLFGIQDKDRAFAALVLHPDLRPVRMDPRAVGAWSALQKRQLIEFARRLEGWILRDAGRLDDLLTEEE